MDNPPNIVIYSTTLMAEQTPAPDFNARLIFPPGDEGEEVGVAMAPQKLWGKENSIPIGVGA